MSTELKKDGTLNLNPMLGVYDRHPRGSALWAEAWQCMFNLQLFI
jgi:hypothetical protein